MKKIREKKTQQKKIKKEGRARTKDYNMKDYLAGAATSADRASAAAEATAISFLDI